MPDEQSTLHDTADSNAAAASIAASDTTYDTKAAGAAPCDTAVQAPPQTLAYEPLEEDGDWLEEPEELPARPRRRLLGVGGNPLPLALLGVLLIACGFIGGVLVEKGQTSSSTGSSAAASGLAARFAALRGAGATGSTTTGSGTGSGASSGASASAAGGGGFAGRFGGLGGAGGATIGEVSYISGDTLYVTDAEGNTVKVTTSPASSITKTVKSDLHGIHPGETVVIRGAKGSGGAVSAESISVSAAGAAGGGGLSSLFGGSSSSGAAGGSRSGGSTSSLFGNGG